MEFRFPYLIHQDRARVVTDDIHDSRGDPSPNSVTIVKTCNCWGDKSFRTKFCRSGNTDLGKPSLIPCDLVVYIEVCRVILIFVCKCVGDVGKCIKVRSGSPPSLQLVQVGTCRGVGIFSWCGGPEVYSRSEGLLKLKRGVNLICIFDRTNTANLSGLINIVRILRIISICLRKLAVDKYLDISISVVANFHKVIGARW